MIPYLIDKDFDLNQLRESEEYDLFSSDNLALYVLNANPSIPTNNGVGVLADATYCRANHVLNGEDEIVMKYPITGALFDKIELRAVIVANVDRTRGNQPYRIYRITKPLHGIVTIYARHLAYDLAGVVVEPFTATGIQAALSGLKSHAMTNNPFTFVSTRSTASKFKVTVPSPVWSLMGGQSGSLLDVYGGEYLFDGYTVHLENHIGADNGVSVRYGVNMTDLEQDANCADCYTGVVAYWQSQDEDDDTVVYSPVMSAAGTYGYVKILTVDMSSKWETAPTQTQLKTAASAYIVNNKIGVPKVSWKVGFVPLDTTEEYKDIAALERVSLGDTVGVHFEKLGVDASARVRSIEWDVLLGRYISVELGDVKNNIADTIVQQTREIEKTPTKREVQSLAAQISKTLTASILGAEGGSVRFLDTNNDGEPDTLYIADNPDPEQAVKVWRFNYEGWGASENGYNGPFKLGATLNDGLLADFVTAANLTAGKIQSADGSTFVLDLDNGLLDMSGTLTLGGTNNVYGKLIINNMIGEPIAESDWMGISFYSGLSHADKHIFHRISRNGFFVNFSPTADGTGGGSVVGIGGTYSGTTGYGTISVGNVEDGMLYPTIMLDGSTGRINCKELYINGVPVTP